MGTSLLPVLGLSGRDEVTKALGAGEPSLEVLWGLHLHVQPHHEQVEMIEHSFLTELLFDDVLLSISYWYLNMICSFLYVYPLITFCYQFVFISVLKRDKIFFHTLLQNKLNLNYLVFKVVVEFTQEFHLCQQQACTFSISSRIKFANLPSQNSPMSYSKFKCICSLSQQIFRAPLC